MKGVYLENIIAFLVTFFASVIGAISGIGGGIIIKPVLELTGLIPIKTLHFLSGITVLCMSFSVLLMRGKQKVHLPVSTFLVIGSILGGYLGSLGFKYLSFLMPKNQLNLLSATLLLLINVGVFVYVKNKTKIKTKHCSHFLISTAIGVGLGVISAFLGIGGGPLNVIILFFFFSFSPKETAINSLFVIFFAQVSSLLTTLGTHSVPAFQWSLLLVMAFGGVVGAIIGRKLSNRMTEKHVSTLFEYVLFFILLINIANVLQYLFLR